MARYTPWTSSTSTSSLVARLDRRQSRRRALAQRGIERGVDVFVHEREDVRLLD